MLSSNFVCSYFNEDDFKNKEYKSKLDELLGKPEQIIFIDIQYCNFSFSLFDLLSRAKNIIVFFDENIRRDMNIKEYNWILKEYNNILKKFMLKCRNLILNSRPKFALVVHKGNFEFSTGPVDHPFINMIQDSNLHNYINIVPQHCYQYKNTYKLDYQSISLGILNKYFKENVEESLVILTIRGKTVFEQLEKSSNFVCSFFNEDDFKKEEYKRKLDELLGKPGQIIVFRIQYSNFSNALISLPTLAKNIIIFFNSWIMKHKSECRNLILNLRPKFALVVHVGNIEEFTGTANHPFLNMIEDTDLNDYISGDDRSGQ